jgi:AcrR family transcriptional regulator
VLGESKPDWRADRREAARSQILEHAWELARERGLLGFSLRDLARRLGMAAPSLYSYFDSKAALYDAMFADGYRAFLAVARPPAEDLRTEMLAGARRFAAFAQADPVRYQLLYQRTIPGWEPSSESYALAQQAYELDFAPMRDLGLVRQEDLDLVSGVVAGLVAQQMANEPRTDRWVRLLDVAIDLLMQRFSPVTAPRRPARSGARK